MRILLATLLLAAGLSGAVALHGYTEQHRIAGCVATPPALAPIGTQAQSCLTRRHPGWADPLAVFIAIAGVGTAASLVLSSRP